MAELLETPAAQPTPEDAALATIKTIVEKRDAAAEKAFLDQYDIRDPGQQISSPAPAGTQTPAAPPRTIEGAVTIPDALLNQAVALGISTQQAQSLGEDGIRRILANVGTPTETQPQPQYNFDPVTGKRLIPEPPPEEELPTLDDANARFTDPETGEERPGRYDEHLKEVLSKQAQALKKATEKLRVMEEREMQREQSTVAQQNARDFARFEKAIQADEEFRDVFGEGPAEQLVGTVYHSNRHALALEADKARKAGLAQTIEQAIDIAKYKLYRDRVLGGVSRRTERDISSRAEAASHGYVARTTARTDDDGLPPGDEKALRTLERLTGRRR